MPVGQIKAAVTDVARITSDFGLSERQASAVLNFLNGLTKEQACLKAGYSPGSSGMVFRSRSVQDALAAALDRFLVGELAPLAVNTISQMLADTKTPPGVRATLALGVLDRSGYSPKRFESKQETQRDPTQMSPEELQREVEKLQRALDDRLRDVTPDDEPAPAQDLDLYE